MEMEMEKMERGKKERVRRRGRKANKEDGSESPRGKAENGQDEEKEQHLRNE